jgi:hypothetical protein
MSDDFIAAKIDPKISGDRVKFSGVASPQGN